MTKKPDPNSGARAGSPSRVPTPVGPTPGEPAPAGPSSLGQVDLSFSEVSPAVQEGVPAGKVGRGGLQPVTPGASAPASSPVSPGASAPNTGRGAGTSPTRTEEERRNRARFLGFLRVFAGWATLATLAYFMWTPGEWPTKLMVWVVLTILADEFGGWFGYLGLVLGGLSYLSPNAPPEQWLVILPLVGGALMGLLLVKHSGGALVLPFAGALYAGTLLAVARFGLKFDPELKLPADDTFLRAALIAMLAGLAVSLVRQLTGLLLRRQARVRARRAGLPGDAQADLSV